MNYQQYFPRDVVNGPGVRCTLFVSGCEHRCPGCYNARTWPLASGVPFTETMIEQVITDLNDPAIPRRGLTLTGGDPLHPANVAAVEALVCRVRAECPGRDIWAWTGYVLEALTPAQWRLVDRLDTVVDGPFIQAQASPGLSWRGSANQRVINIRMLDNAE